jgi:hypothetical protein
MSVADLPAVNAALNSICTILLLAGWWFIKHERKRQHIICMVSAMGSCSRRSARRSGRSAIRMPLSIGATVVASIMRLRNCWRSSSV